MGIKNGWVVCIKVCKSPGFNEAMDLLTRSPWAMSTTIPTVVLIVLPENNDFARINDTFNEPATGSVDIEWMGTFFPGEDSGYLPRDESNEAVDWVQDKPVPGGFQGWLDACLEAAKSSPTTNSTGNYFFADFPT